MGLRSNLRSRFLKKQTDDVIIFLILCSFYLVANFLPWLSVRIHSGQSGLYGVEILATLPLQSISEYLFYYVHVLDSFVFRPSLCCWAVSCLHSSFYPSAWFFIMLGGEIEPSDVAPLSHSAQVKQVTSPIIQGQGSVVERSKWYGIWHIQSY